MYDILKDDLEKPLFLICGSFTNLPIVLILVNIKIRNGWTNKKFTLFLGLLTEMLSKSNTWLTHQYETKNVLLLMDMEYKKLHDCTKVCILYKRVFEVLHKFPRCGVSKVKAKDYHFSILRV